ncbi:acetyltransferase [bacterium]|nr:acetyltransferase [bacterium]
MNDSKKNVIIIGGLGNGSVIAAAIRDANRRGYNEWQAVGYLNDRIIKGDSIEGLPVLGSLDDIQYFTCKGYYFIYTIYRIDGQNYRIELFKRLNIPEEQLAVFIHPAAYIADNVHIGFGTVVMPNVSISPGTTIGKCCLIMVNATIGHNNKIGAHCHFAAQSCLGAYLNIGDGVHIGLNATVRENLTLGKYSALGMGAVLLNDIKEYEIWAGVPAKFLRNSKREFECLPIDHTSGH